MNKYEQEQHLIELRRSQVYELHAKGVTIANKVYLLGIILRYKEKM